MKKGKKKYRYFPLKRLTEDLKDEIIKNMPLRIAPCGRDISPAAGIDIEARKEEDEIHLKKKRTFHKV